MVFCMFGEVVRKLGDKQVATDVKVLRYILLSLGFSIVLHDTNRGTAQDLSH